MNILFAKASSLRGVPGTPNTARTSDSSTPGGAATAVDAKPRDPGEISLWRCAIPRRPKHGGATKPPRLTIDKINELHEVAHEIDHKVRNLFLFSCDRITEYCTFLMLSLNDYYSSENLYFFMLSYD